MTNKPEHAAERIGLAPETLTIAGLYSFKLSQTPPKALILSVEPGFFDSWAQSIFFPTERAGGDPPPPRANPRPG